MSEVKQLKISKVGKFDSDFLFSINIKVKAIYSDIYKKKRCEAIISFLNGRDISVIKGNKLIIDIEDATFSTVLFSEVTESRVMIKIPDGTRIKSDIKKGVSLEIGNELVLDVFKNAIRVRH